MFQISNLKLLFVTILFNKMENKNIKYVRHVFLIF